jgi:hypothetical protein
VHVVDTVVFTASAQIPARQWDELSAQYWANASFLRKRICPKLLKYEVRFGSLADIGGLIWNVRFTPESGHPARRNRCPLSAINGHG